MKKGKFIVLEGGEGTGKSTLAREIEQVFGMLRTREPGGTPFAEKIREEVLYQKAHERLSVEAEFAAMWSARADHIDRLILPHLEAGKHVVCPRFDGSTFAYQVCAEVRDDLFDPFRTMRRAYLTKCQPDLYLILDLPVEEGLARMRASTTKRSVFDDRDESYHEEVRQGFLEFADNVTRRARVIDASQPFEQVKAEAFDHIMRL